MATARAAIGTLLRRNGVALALITDIEGPGIKGDTIDTTNHNNPDNFKEFITGLKEGGDVKAKILYDPLEDTHAQLYTAISTSALDIWEIIPPVAGAPIWTFTGVMTQLDTKYKVNAAIEADITIKVSGKPTLA